MTPLLQSLRWAALAALLSLAACATITPEQKTAYAEAQAEVQRLEADPLANQAASKPLQDARVALTNADEAARRGNGNDVMYWSYLAARRAQVGTAMIAELRARDQIVAATADRDRLLLETQRHRAELAQTQAQRAEERARTAEQQLQEERQQQQAQDTERQLAQTRDQAEQQVLQAQQQAEEAKRQLEEMQATQTARGMVLTLSGSLLFSTGGDTLEPGAIRPLGNIAQFMERHPMMKIRVEGFTDGRGSDELNDALSQRRAEAVAKALESDGVDASRILSIGRGKSLPVASNDTAAGRQQNRRVELVFSDTQGQFASTGGADPLR